MSSLIVVYLQCLVYLREFIGRWHLSPTLSLSSLPSLSSSSGRTSTLDSYFLKSCCKIQLKRKKVASPFPSKFSEPDFFFEEDIDALLSWFGERGWRSHQFVGLSLGCLAKADIQQLFHPFPIFVPGMQRWVRHSFCFQGPWSLIGKKGKSIKPVRPLSQGA